MTINHVMMRVSKANLETLRSFYVAVLEPLGYKEMMRKGDLIAFGSDFPYFWLQGTPDDQKPLPLHVALDAPSNEAVDKFYETALTSGAKDNGPPGIRPQLPIQPYYAAFIRDVEGNNIEVVSIKK